MSGYYDAIPELTKRTMDNYVNHGIPMGDFLQAVFRNDLIDAIGRADEQNMANLKLIVQYMYNQLPSDCWGSKERIKAWVENGGLNGRDES